MAFPILTLLIGLTLPQSEDGVVVASHQEAAVAIDRTTVRRSGNRVSATMLMGMFRPETPPGSTAEVKYYLSDETVDCTARARFEHEVRVYSPEGEMLGTSPPDPDTSIGTGSAYAKIYETLCAAESGLEGEGHATPLEAIRAEATERRASGRAVND